MALPLAASESAAVPARYELNSAKLIIDLARMTYAAENDRTKSLDAKAGGLLGATCAVLARLAGTVTRPPGRPVPRPPVSWPDERREDDDAGG